MQVDLVVLNTETETKLENLNRIFTLNSILGLEVTLSELGINRWVSVKVLNAIPQ